jgi:hypothetical protein
MNDGRHSEIMVMEWKHMDAKLNSDKTIKFIQEIIQGMAGGKAAHQADTLKFGLYAALRQNGPTKCPFAQL